MTNEASESQKPFFGKGQMPIGLNHRIFVTKLDEPWQGFRRRHQEQKQNLVCLLGSLKQVVTALRLSSTVEIKLC